MKILAITSAPPWPAAHGAALRNGLLLEALARRHEVDLVTLDRPRAAPVPAPSALGRVVQLCAAPPTLRRRLWVGLRIGAPDLVVRHASVRLRGRAQMLLHSRGYDAVHVAQAQLAPLLHDVHASAASPANRPRLVYDAHNVEWTLQAALARASRGPRAVWAAVQAARLRRLEAWAVRLADCTIAASRGDLASLRALGAAAAVHVPHPVRVPPRPAALEERAERPRVLLAANFDYRPNVMAAEWLFGSIWPRLLRRVPSAELRVIGPRSPDLRPIAPARCVIGGVVDDVDREYARAWLAVSPTAAAAGAPYKVLCALAAGRPVVARRRGYVGLPAPERIGAAAPANADGFLRALVELLTNPAAYRRAAAAGVAYVTAEHSQDRVAAQLLEVYDQLSARARVDAPA